MVMRILSKNIFSRDSVSAPDAESRKGSRYWLRKLYSRVPGRTETSHAVQIETNTTPSITEASIDSPGTVQEIVQKAEVKGFEEAVTSQAGKAERNRQAVEDMVANSNRIITRVSTVFPWDFFPSSIIVEEKRITIIHRQLFSSQVHSIDIKNISNVFINTGILFAQLTFISATFAQNEIVINMLWKEDAIELRRIIEGLRLFISKDIDTTGYEVQELINKLKELSTRKIVL